VVSHDRYFMDKIVDHLFVFGERKITDFPGNYSDYRAIKQLEQNEKYAQPSEKTSVPAEATQKTATTAKLSYQEQKEYKRLESDIKKLEREKEQLEAKFLSDLSPEEIKENSIKLQDISDKIDQKTEKWFEISMKIDA